MRNLDGIAGGVDVGIGGLQVVIHLDAAALAPFEAGCLCELRFGLHADGQEHEVGRQRVAIAKLDAKSVLGLAERRRRRSEVNAHAVPAHVVLQLSGHLRVQRRHDLIEHLDHVDLEPALAQALRHLATDVPGADNHGTFGASGAPNEFVLADFDGALLTSSGSGSEYPRLSDGDNMELVITGTAANQATDGMIVLTFVEG